ncbi:hypothetical protein ES708_16560 [subsurface metagenome]
MIKLQPGDIFATRGSGLLGWLSRRLMEPENDRYHYGIILQKWQEDYLILESISKGLSIGRLSFYEGADIKFYRVDCPQGLRKAAPFELTRWGRSRYDYLLVAKLVAQGLWLLLWLRRRIRPEELTWSQDNVLLCSEGVDIAYDAVGVNIIPLHVCPTPSAFKQAEFDGRIKELKEVFSG